MRRISVLSNLRGSIFSVLYSLLLTLLILTAQNAFAAPPIVTITSPAPGLTNDNTPLLTYTVNDPTAVIAVTVNNGTPFTKPSGESLDPLPDGTHTVKVSATNAANETGYAEVTIIVDTAPPGQLTFTSISSGKGHTMMLRADGTLWAVGENGSGQLGDGTATNRSFPVRVNAPNETDTRWNAVAAGALHTLAVKNDGTLWAWGGNASGQLGVSTSITSHTRPNKIDDTPAWTTVAAGHNHSMAVANGALYTWGDNNYGQLGNGNTTSTYIKQQVAGITGVVAMAGGLHHSLALTAGGGVYAWGRNHAGQVGDPADATNHTTPFSLGTGWLQIAAGGFHSLALNSTGKLYAWGYNWYGQLGNNDTTKVNRTEPTPIMETATWSRIAGGFYHSAALQSNGTLWAWGMNDQSQVGAGAANPQLAPIRIGQDADWLEVSAGHYHTIALKSDGTFWAWGDNSYGISGSAAPTPVVGSGTWSRIAAGLYHSIGVKTDNTLWSWGYDNNGQLGNGDPLANSSTPAPVKTDHTGVAKWIAVAAGTFHGLAVGCDDTLTACSLWSWGSDAYGQLGDDTALAGKKAPVQVGQNTTWKEVAAGAYHSVGLTKTGELYTWGYNAQGQIGNNTTSQDPQTTSTPYLVAAEAGHSWKKIAAGAYFSLAIRDDDTLWAWGNNNVGQLGIENTKLQATPPQQNPATQPLPVQVTIPNRPFAESTWQAVAAGTNHVLALHTDGTLWAWGSGDSYQIGKTPPSTTTYKSPVQISAATGWADISAGQWYSFALKSSGDLFAWGYNNYGQLGDNSTTTRSQWTQIGAGSAWSAISTKVAHTLALKTDGTLWAWGYNAYGQLGDGAPVIRSSPRQADPVIVINNNATHTKEPAVVLSLNISDANPVTEMQISNDGTAWTSRPWPSPDIFSTTAGWTLSPDDGVKTVSVRFKDSAGNWSAVYSDTIILDITPPVITITSPVAGLNENTTPLLSYTVSDGTVTAVMVDTTPVLTRSGQNFDPLPAGQRKIRVEAKDALENVGFAEVIIDIPTYISGGVISTDTIWALETSPYIVNANIYVEGGATLQINAGVVVMFAANKGLYIGSSSSAGSLVARGTADKHITLTRKDASGAWGKLSFADRTVDSTAILEYADIAYSSGVELISASPTIINSTITDVTGYGIDMSNASPILENTTIRNNGTYGIRLYNSSPVITGGSLTNTSPAGYGIYASSGSPVVSNYSVTLPTTAKHGVYLNITSSTLSITNSMIDNGLYLGSTNIFPSITGNIFNNLDNAPLHAGANIIGQILDNNTVNDMTAAGRIEVVGETINRDTQWRKWDAPYVVTSGIVYVYKDAVSPSTLAIDPGVTVKFGPNTSLQAGYNTNLKGVLVARGGAGSGSIRFTASQTTPTIGYWNGVSLSGAASDASVLENVIIEYAGPNVYNAALTVHYSAPIIRNCTFRNSAGWGVYFSGALNWPVIMDSEITGNKCGIYSSGSNPIIYNTKIYSNTEAGVSNAPSSPDVDARNNWWGASAGPTLPNTTGPGDKISAGVLYNPWIGQEPGTGLSITDARALPTSLNPEGDFVRFTAKISASANWTITLIDSNNLVVKTFTGSGTAIDQNWYGENGQPVPTKVADGDYYYRIDAVDPANGSAASPHQGLLMVSRNIPIAIMDPPKDNQMSPGGTTLNITGTASDNTRFMLYFLEYGAGENPVSWSRITPYNVTTQIVNGLLASWNTTGLAEGIYSVRLTVKNYSNNIAYETARVRLLRIQNAAASEPFISPNVDGVKDTSTISAAFNYPSSWTLTFKDEALNEIVRTYAGSGTAINQVWDGKNESGQVVADGTYTWQLDAVSSETGIAAVAKMGTITVDRTSPVAQITAPAADSVIRNAVTIAGTASDANLESYTLEYGPVSGSGPWTQIQTATTSVTSGTLATWNTNDSTKDVLLDNGAYNLRLTSTDKAGNISTTSITVNADNLILSNIGIGGHTINTYLNETRTVSFSINAPATVTFKIVPERGGSDVYMSTINVTVAGTESFIWDGKYNIGVKAGKPVEDEAYLYVLEATDGTRTDTYIPSAPVGAGTVETCIKSPNYNPAKNIPMVITYTPAQPCRVNINIVWWYATYTVLGSFPATPGNHTYEWDGRTPGNKLLDIFTTPSCTVASLLPENYLITTGDTVKITDLKTDPYAQEVSYGQFTRITYTLSRDANVTVTITSPSGSVTTLLSNQFQSAGQQNLEWNALDAADSTGTKTLVVGEGNYMVSVQAVNPATGSSSTRRANLRVGY